MWRQRCRIQECLANCKSDKGRGTHPRATCDHQSHEQTRKGTSLCQYHTPFRDTYWYSKGTCRHNASMGSLLGICMHQGQSRWILASYSWFCASISLILLFWFTSMSLHFSLYFSPFFSHYSRIYSWRGTSHLLLLWGYARTPTFRLELTTRRVFASTIPMHLHPLDAGLSKTFPWVMGRVEMRAAYDLIGKSWPRARYMRSEPCNTVSLSSVLDHHWGGELRSTSSIVFLLTIP